jgi:hypothetical protein
LAIGSKRQRTSDHLIPPVASGYFQVTRCKQSAFLQIRIVLTRLR